MFAATSIGPPSRRARVKRAAQRADYEAQTIRAVLEEAIVAHVGISQGEQPFVLPMVCALSGEHLLLHGSQGSRLMRSMRDGAELCITVTLLDGLVLARSAFHTSVNYRCVVLFGRAEEISDRREKLAALHAIVEHAVPGRWDDVRGPNDAELRQTLVVRVPIAEASAKVRAEGPIEEEDDYQLPCWAGVLPLRLSPGVPSADERLASGAEPPEYIASYKRGR